MSRLLGVTFAVLVVAGCGGAEPAKGPRVVRAAKPAGAPPPIADPCASKDGEALTPEKLEGTRIAAICLTGASTESIAVAREALRLGPNKPVTARALRYDLEAIYETGYFEQVEATARAREPSASVIVIALTERPRLEALTFEGGTITGEPARALFLKDGEPVSPSRIMTAALRLKEAYATEGWDEATVSHAITPAGPGKARVKITVVEGTRAKLGKVTFPGARAVGEEELRKTIELMDGAPFNAAQLRHAIQLLSALYWDRGYATVSVDEPTRARGADGAVALAFKVVEGPLFRVGKISVKGDAARAKEILAGMRTKPGDVYNRSRLVADLDALRKGKDGKRASVEPETELDPKRGIIDITFGVVPE